MFKKNNKSEASVMHYSGLADFAQDYPCKITMDKNNFIIKRIKPETTITLLKDKILSFSAVEEERFMLRYHGQATSTSKAKGVKKYYLVVNYKAQDGAEKMLAFWGTVSEWKKFNELQNMDLGNSQSYSL